MNPQPYLLKMQCAECGSPDGHHHTRLGPFRESGMAIGICDACCGKIRAEEMLDKGIYFGADEPSGAWH
jgi:hypothetical protein